MNCPECNKKIDSEGIVWHFRKIHEYSEYVIIGILFDKIYELEKKFEEVINMKEKERIKKEKPKHVWL